VLKKFIFLWRFYLGNLICRWQSLQRVKELLPLTSFEVLYSRPFCPVCSVSKHKMYRMSVISQSLFFIDYLFWKRRKLVTVPFKNLQWQSPNFKISWRKLQTHFPLTRLFLLASRSENSLIHNKPYHIRGDPEKFSK